MTTHDPTRDPTPAGRTRPAVDALPAYRPGKGAAQAEAEHGITNAIKLASNENPLPPVASILAAVAEAAAGANRYADHRATAVRERLASWLGVDVERITVGAGSVGLLQQLFLTYVDPGDEVVYPWRSFEVYPVYTQLMNGTAVTIPLTSAHAFDLDAVAAAVTPATKLVLLATPNNPTGTALRTSEIAELLTSIDLGTIVVHTDRGGDGGPQLGGAVIGVAVQSRGRGLNGGDDGVDGRRWVFVRGELDDVRDAMLGFRLLDALARPVCRQCGHHRTRSPDERAVRVVGHARNATVHEQAAQR